MKHFDPPDHHVDGGDHVVPLWDEAVEDVAVEDGSQDSNRGEERPPARQPVLALGVPRPGHVVEAGLGDGPGEEKEEDQYHQSLSALHALQMKNGKKFLSRDFPTN